MEQHETTMKKRLARTLESCLPPGMTKETEETPSFSPGVYLRFHIVAYGEDCPICGPIMDPTIKHVLEAVVTYTFDADKKSVPKKDYFRFKATAEQQQELYGCRTNRTDDDLLYVHQ